MAFQQTSASGQDDVIQQFIAFAVANAGFTDAGSTLVPGATSSGLSNGRTIYRCSKGGLTWGFSRSRAGTNIRPDFGFYIILSFNASLDRPEADVVNTPSTPFRVSCWDFAGPYSNVYMYTDGTAVHCAIELASGIFTHFSIGSITKTETFTGGEYVAGIGGSRQTGDPLLYNNLNSSYMCPYFPGVRLQSAPAGGSYHSNANFYASIRAVPLSGTNTGYSRFAHFSRDSNNNNASGEGINGMSEQWQHESYHGSTNGLKVNTENQRTPLWPNIIRLDHQTNNLWRMSGHIPSMRFCYIDFLNPGDIILNDWQVFPYTQKNGDRVQCPNSGGYGVAYKRV